MRSWITDNELLLRWLGGASVGVCLATLVVVPLLIMRIPADYFLRLTPAPMGFRAQHPAIRLFAIVIKNLVGGVLLLVGLGMLLLPGSGVVTILAGLMLMNFPGKRRLELALIRLPPVRRFFDWVRRRAGRPPLQLPGPDVARPHRTPD